MENKKPKEKRNNSIRLLTKQVSCFIFLVFLFLQKIFSQEIIIPKTKSIVGELVSIKILLDGKNFAHLKNNADNIKIISTSEFEIVNYELKKQIDNIEVLFEIKIFSLGKNIFNIFLNTKQINQTPIIIYTSFDEINTDTKFIWKLYSREDEQLVETPVQGEKYFLILCGEFENTLTKIKKVEWYSSENILLEIIESSENIKNITSDMLPQVISFNFVPLHYDIVNLPEIKIFYADTNQKEKTLIVPTQTLSTIKNTNLQKKQPLRRNLITTEKSLEKTSKEKILLAKENHKLRNELNKSIFKFKNIFKINEVEKDLKIKKSFFAGEKYLNFLIFILLCLTLLFLLIKFKLKKVLINLLTFVILILSITCLKKTFAKYAVVCGEYDVLIKIIPEANSESLVTVTAGETLIIKSVLNNWCYVKTYNGFEGWIEKENILIIEK